MTDVLPTPMDIISLRTSSCYFGEGEEKMDAGEEGILLMGVWIPRS